MVWFSVAPTLASYQHGFSLFPVGLFSSPRSPSKCKCHLRRDGGSQEHFSQRGIGIRRRDVLLMTIFIQGAAGSAQAEPTATVKEPGVQRFRQTLRGVKIEEILEGEGAEANVGDLVEFNYVLRRANGYYVFSTVDQFGGASEPVVLPLGRGKIIPGLEEVLVGMKPGGRIVKVGNDAGKRRALVPPGMGYTDLSLEPLPQDFGPRRSLLSHADEPLVFEVQLLRIK